MINDSSDSYDFDENDDDFIDDDDFNNELSSINTPPPPPNASMPIQDINDLTTAKKKKIDQTIFKLYLL